MKENRVRTIREKMGLTLSAVAIASDTEPGLLSLVVRGKRCSPKVQQRISAALGVPVKKLFPEG